MKNSAVEIKTIGLVIEDAFTDFAREIIRTISGAVKDRKDLRLVILAGRQDDSLDPWDRMHQYKIMYNQIYAINEAYRFDGLLLTFPNQTRMRRDLYAGIPRVYLATEMEDELTVNYDAEPGIREAVDYLVKIRGLTRLCMLGGRDDNADARGRKEIFSRCLAENGLEFTDDQYEKTDMSTRTQAPAERLLARNPDVQAIFCVNDAAAVGLYDALRRQGRVPGKDITVFGFDNGPIAGELVPPLASVGSEGAALGQKALELLLDRMEGRQVSSRTVPTRLYGRESFEYEMFSFTARELLNASDALINSFFDNCFYRYRHEIVGAGAINLKRLFFEILSRMLRAVRTRYISEEEYRQLSWMIDVLFDNGIMLYTDPNRFVRSVSGLQGSMGEMRKTGFVMANIDRLFSRMKDRAIQFQGVRKRMDSDRYNVGRTRIQEFMTWATNYGPPGEEALAYMIRQLDRIGLENAALFLYPSPVRVRDGKADPLPGAMALRCVIREGELFVIPEGRQLGPVSELYDRSELPREKRGYISYPLFCGRDLYGMLVCGADSGVFEIGEFLTFQLSRAIYMNWGGRTEQ